MMIEDKKKRGDSEENKSSFILNEEDVKTDGDDVLRRINSDNSDEALDCTLLLKERDENEPSPHGTFVSDEVDEEMNFTENETYRWIRRIRRIFLMNWIDDEPPSIPYPSKPYKLCGKIFRLQQRQIPSNDNIEERALVFENAESIKLVKFFVLTLILLVCTHYFVRAMKWEYDDNFDLNDFFLYDFMAVVLDMFAYFIVGRLFKRKGVDRIYPCVLPMIVGCIFPSLINEWKIFQYSFSMFEIMCHWPPPLFIAMAIALMIIITIIYLHVRTFYRQGLVLSRLMELSLLIAIFLCPTVNDPNSHFHHWYAAWLIGILANSHESWSIATLCFAWGYYINGIAVYGRDPILGCKHSFYNSINMNCGYMQCFLDQNATNTTNTTVYKKFIPPDWRTCTEGYYAY